MAGDGRHKGDAALVTALAAGMRVRDTAERDSVSDRTDYRRLFDSPVEAEAFRALPHHPNGVPLARIPAGPVTVGELAELVRPGRAW